VDKASAHRPASFRGGHLRLARCSQCHPRPCGFSNHEWRTVGPSPSVILTKAAIGR
jgi:hypothetical protein